MNAEAILISHQDCEVQVSLRGIELNDPVSTGMFHIYDGEAKTHFHLRQHQAGTVHWAGENGPEREVERPRSAFVSCED